MKLFLWQPHEFVLVFASFLHPQQTATCSFPEQDEYSSHPTIPRPKQKR